MLGEFRTKVQHLTGSDRAMHMNLKCRRLQPKDRMTIARLKQKSFSWRAIAAVLGRAAGTVSRGGLRRNGDADADGYSCVNAQGGCGGRRRQSRTERKPHPDSILFGVVLNLLRLHGSPAQIARMLARLYPRGDARRVSHGTIYNCIYAMPEGEA